MQVKIIKPDFVVCVKDQRGQGLLLIKLIEIVGQKNLSFHALNSLGHENVGISYFTIRQQNQMVYVGVRENYPSRDLEIVAVDDLIPDKTSIIAAIETPDRLS